MPVNLIFFIIILTTKDEEIISRHRVARALERQTRLLTQDPREERASERLVHALRTLSLPRFLDY